MLTDLSSSEEHFQRALAAARNDTPWGYNALYNSLAGRVLNYLRARNASQPDELCNETFLKAFKALDQFVGDEGGFRSWVFTIAHRLLLDDIRKTQRQWRLRPVPMAVGNSEQDALDRLGSLAVKELLADLAPDQANVLLLRIIADLSIEEAASALGKSPGAVKALQHRALEALRKKFRRDPYPIGTAERLEVQT